MNLYIVKHRPNRQSMFKPLYFNDDGTVSYTILSKATTFKTAMEAKLALKDKFRLSYKISIERL